MFSGIVEGQTRVLSLSKREGVSELVLEKPIFFDSIAIGDSLAVNGICLTLEKYDSQTLSFAVGPETLSISKWSTSLQGQMVNVERSLRLGDRIHGHVVTGHVDGLAEIIDSKWVGEISFLTLAVPVNLRKMIWKKGSLTVNGVSLTINEVQQGQVELCLIPETLRRTNLSDVQKGDFVTIEVDNLARGLLHIKELDQ